MRPPLYLFVVLLNFNPAESTSREACCTARGVSSVCARKLCDVSRVPNDVDRYALFGHAHNCQQYLNDIAVCIADGRDSTDCCKQHAEDGDENVCFGLCAGAIALSPDWRRMQTCIGINMPEMYDCINKGYKIAPSPPTNLRVEGRGERTALIWDPPETNADAVQRYKVYFNDITDVANAEIVRETKLTRLDLSSLSAPLRQYSVYVIAVGRDGKSLASDALITKPVAATDDPLEQLPKTTAASGAEQVTLACAIKTRHYTPGMVWERRVAGSWKVLEGSRFSTVFHASTQGNSNAFMGSLQIFRLVDNDAGVYRCHLKGYPSDYREMCLNVVSLSAPASVPNPTPPETLLDCCSRKITRPQCSSVCTPGSDRQPWMRPGAFLPRVNCSDELQHLMQCAMAVVQSAPCCIRQKVPFECLGFCDRKLSLPSTYMVEVCAEHLTDVYSCHEESFRDKPSGISGLVVHTRHGVTSLDWNSSDRASSYTIYYRSRGQTWKVLTTSKTSAKVRGADEISILSANSVGESTSIRMAYENSMWETTNS